MHLLFFSLFRKGLDEEAGLCMCLTISGSMCTVPIPYIMHGDILFIAFFVYLSMTVFMS